MTQPQETLSAMERQGALLQDLARVLLTSVDLTEQWQKLTAAFIPDGEGWAGRIVVTDLDGSSSGGDARFATDSQVTLLLDAMQQASAEHTSAQHAAAQQASAPAGSEQASAPAGSEQASAPAGGPFVSLRLDAERTGEDRDRIALASDLNYDRDPGSFDGVGGVDQQVARRFVERFGADAAPAWMRDLLSEH